jgi:oligopeptide/dipeptide ABC transporter ATP-binding protein
VAPRRALFATPLMPYTQALLAAVPIPDPGARRPRLVLPGEPPSPTAPPPGCPFHPRCLHPRLDDGCRTRRPSLEEKAPGHFVACHHVPIERPVPAPGPAPAPVPSHPAAP